MDCVVCQTHLGIDAPDKLVLDGPALTVGFVIALRKRLAHGLLLIVLVVQQ